MDVNERGDTAVEPTASYYKGLSMIPTPHKVGFLRHELVKTHNNL